MLLWYTIIMRLDVVMVKLSLYQTTINQLSSHTMARIRRDRMSSRRSSSSSSSSSSRSDRGRGRRIRQKDSSN
jgi:hypothetical protein